MLIASGGADAYPGVVEFIGYECEGFEYLEDAIKHIKDKTAMKPDYFFRNEKKYTSLKKPRYQSRLLRLKD